MMAVKLPSVLQPLSRRLPLLAALTLLLLLAVSAWIGAHRLRNVVTAAELGRLQAAAHRIATNVEGSVRRIEREDERLASHSLFADHLSGAPAAGALERVRAELDSQRTRNSQ